MKSKRFLLKYRGTECLNCGQDLDVSEKYCHNCGQLNSTKRLTFKDFFNEFFSGIFAYDSRLYQTLKVLFFNPGKISEDYIHGKRERYVNPYKFYLSVSIIFFLLSGFLDNLSPGQDEENVIVAGDGVPSSGSIPAEATGIAIDSLLFSYNKNKTLEEIYIPQSQLDSMSFWKSTEKKLGIFSKKYKESKITVPKKALESLAYTNSAYNRWLYKKIINLNTIFSNIDLFLDYFIAKMPFIIFFYLPVFALFIWLLYVRRPFTYMDHLIFTFHSQSMWFVAFGLAMIIDFIFNTDIVTILAIFGFLFYLYKSMRKFYGQNRVKTFVKFFILNGIFLFLAGIAVIFSILASFAIY